MGTWLALFSGLVTGGVLLLRWYLSADQKDKRRDDYVWKLERKLRKALAAGDTDAIVHINGELRLFAEKGQPATRPKDKPGDTANE